jgi:DNA repair photolyase
MSVVYRPKGQAAEYAPLALNLYNGCGHRCAYCYVVRLPQWAMKHGSVEKARKVFDEGAVLRPGVLEQLRRDAAKLQAAGCREQVMLSFTTDPYPPDEPTTPASLPWPVTRMALKILRAHDIGFCTLTKGGTRAVRDLDLFRPESDAFACTLTSLDSAFSGKWEPGAAHPSDRVAALRDFHEAGIFTWVSLEPTLDLAHSLAVVEATHRFVDLYKVGRANYLGAITAETDWGDYTRRMIELLRAVGAKHYIKKDLQEYLPAGYVNPMRISQHHGEGP